jgi:hypothetical protein
MRDIGATSGEQLAQTICAKDMANILKHNASQICYVASVARVNVEPPNADNHRLDGENREPEVFEHP